MNLFAVWLCVCITASLAFRGVQVKHENAYSASSTVFRCLDQSTTIPISHVNDEYCDCPDGSDEPGTPACTFETRAVPHWKFQCSDVKYATKEILHSFVNDGICDCCDGSDEYSSGTKCENTCAEAFEKAEKEREARELTRQLGLKAREIMVQEAQQKRAALRQKLEEEQKSIEKLNTDVRIMEDEKRAAEELETLERQKILASSTFEFEKWTAEQELKKKAALEAKQQNPEPPQHTQIICSKWRQTKDCVGAGEREPKDDKECETVIPDGWSGFCECVDTETGADVRFEFDCGHKPLTCAFVCLHDGAEPDTVEEPKEEQFIIDDGSKFELPAAVTARQGLAEKRRAIDDAERRVKELESDLAKDFGPDDALLVLKDKCFELEEREYVYKLCPFGEVVQMRKGTSHGPNMGKWKGFGDQSYSSWGAKQDYTHMKFTDGEHCWGGPHRSTEAHVVCGPETKLLSVEEPSMCTYKMVLQTPAVCE